MELIDAFGSGYAALLGATAIVFFLVVLAPIYYPAFRAFRRRRRLPRPWLFTLAVASHSYGVLLLLLVTISIPLEFYSNFVAPSLESLGYPYGSWVLHAHELASTWWPVVLPAGLLALAVAVTRTLASRWAAICNALAA